MEEEPTPFARYPKAGREPIGINPGGRTNCRHGYGPPVFRVCGAACLYCGRVLLHDYESWLDVSIDHVVPQSVRWYSTRKHWVDDLFNFVTCCRACNEFLARFPCKDAEPNSIETFVSIRDRIFWAKREHTRRRHAEEKAWFIEWHRREKYPAA